MYIKILDKKAPYGFLVAVSQLHFTSRSSLKALSRLRYSLFSTNISTLNMAEAAINQLQNLKFQGDDSSFHHTYILIE